MNALVASHVTPYALYSFNFRCEILENLALLLYNHAALRAVKIPPFTMPYYKQNYTHKYWVLKETHLPT